VQLQLRALMWWPLLGGPWHEWSVEFEGDRFCSETECYISTECQWEQVKKDLPVIRSNCDRLTDNEDNGENRHHLV
jgi:hypothetical protein